MKGSLKERNGSYLITVSLGPDPDNPGKYKRYFETVQTTSKPIAEKRLREVLTELDKGTFTKPSKLTLGEYLDQWVSDYCWTNLSPRAAEAYEYQINKHIKPKLGTIPLKTLQPAQVQKLYTELQKKGHQRTAKYCHQTLHKALKMALKQGIVPRNVTDYVEVPKVDKQEAPFLDQSEAIKFLDTAKDSNYYSMAYLFLSAGLRRSEILALRWSDIDFTSGKLSVTRSLHQLQHGNKDFYFKQPKSLKSRRSIPLPASAVQVMLTEYNNQLDIKKDLLKHGEKDVKPDEVIKPDDLIFCHLDGTPLRPDTISKVFLKLARKAGLTAHLHTLRHSHASILIQQGAHIKVISERLGHSSINITGDIYSHVAAGLQEKAIENFDGFLTGSKALVLV